MTSRPRLVTIFGIAAIGNPLLPPPRRGRVSIAIAALICAFGCTDTKDRAPSRPGGGGVGGGGGGGGDQDAGVDGGAALAISGTLCRLTDLRFFEVCTRTDLSAIDIGVRGSDATALSASDGSFTIDAPASGPIVLEIGFDTPDIKNALFEIARPDGAQTIAATVPVVLQVDYADLLDLLLVLEPDGTGSIAAYARDGGAAVPGVEVVPPPGSQAPFYDAGSALEWSQLGVTGAGGAALIFSVNDEDRAALSLVDSLGASVELEPPVEDGALTFAVGRF